MFKLILAFVTVIVSLCNVGECREVVFVINAGQSMNEYDPFNTAPESVIWGAQNLSADDEAGIIIFNENVYVIRDLSKIKDNPVNEISVEYSGTSDVGAGLPAVKILMSSQKQILSPV